MKVNKCGYRVTYTVGQLQNLAINNDFFKQLKNIVIHIILITYNRIQKNGIKK